MPKSLKQYKAHINSGYLYGVKAQMTFTTFCKPVPLTMTAYVTQ